MFNKKFLLALILLVVLLPTTACTALVTKGSGDMVTETRQVSNFDRIDLSGSGEVIVTQDGNESLTIETDDNVMKNVEAVVENGTLKLGFKNEVNLISPSRLIFHVSVDNLTGLTISGSGDVESDKIETDRLDVTVSGSGDVQIADLLAGEVTAKISGSGEIGLAGEAASQDIMISGSGKYLAGDLCSESVKVSVSGSGDATVCATDSLDANISGSGSINYYGRPTINLTGSGSGKVNSLGDK
jgi:Putative auto-transporter adhesin, head GIN domain